MKSAAKVAIGFGIFFIVIGILMSTGLAYDPKLPLPLAISGAGLFVGGAILASRA